MRYALNPVLQTCLVLLVAAALGGCLNPHVERPSALATLMQIESTVTAGEETLLEAVHFGVVDIHSEDYARAYLALERIHATIDAAWAAYRSNQLGQANTLADLALTSYRDVRPLLYQLAGVAQ